MWSCMLIWALTNEFSFFLLFYSYNYGNNNIDDTGIKSNSGWLLVHTFSCLGVNLLVEKREYLVAGLNLHYMIVHLIMEGVMEIYTPVTQIVL